MDQLEEAVVKHNINRWQLRECSICHAPLHYEFRKDGNIYYHSACDCTPFSSSPRQCKLDEILNLFNVQKPKDRKRMWDEFIESGSKTVNLGKASVKIKIPQK